MNVADDRKVVWNGYKDNKKAKPNVVRFLLYSQYLHLEFLQVYYSFLPRKFQKNQNLFFKMKDTEIEIMNYFKYNYILLVSLIFESITFLIHLSFNLQNNKNICLNYKKLEGSQAQQLIDEQLDNREDLKSKRRKKGKTEHMS
ncbi:hypothetical protein pb186bvf_004121 [Paramecium bursaria]